MRNQRILLLVTALLIATPSLVLASGWSVWTWEAHVTPVGEPETDMCLQSGTVDVAKVEGNMHLYANTWTCGGAGNNVPSGWANVSISGYRDGAFCANSGWYANQNPAYAVGVRWQACSNPAGIQQFKGVSHGRLYNGVDFYFGSYTGPHSPLLGY